MSKTRTVIITSSLVIIGLVIGIIIHPRTVTKTLYINVAAPTQSTTTSTSTSTSTTTTQPAPVATPNVTPNVIADTSSCGKVKEDILTGTHPQLVRDLALLVGDRSANSIARQNAQDYLINDATSPDMQALDLQQIQVFCSI